MLFPRSRKSSSQGHQKTCPCVGSSPQATVPTRSLIHRLQRPSGHINLFQFVVLHGLLCGYLLSYGPPCTSGGQSASLWSSPGVARESWIWYLEHLFAFLLHLPWCQQDCFSHIFPHSSLPSGILSFLKYAFPEAPSSWLWGSAVPCSGSVRRRQGCLTAPITITGVSTTNRVSY